MASLEGEPIGAGIAGLGDRALMPVAWKMGRRLYFATVGVDGQEETKMHFGALFDRAPSAKAFQLGSSSTEELASASRSCRISASVPSEGRFSRFLASNSHKKYCSVKNSDTARRSNGQLLL